KPEIAEAFVPGQNSNRISECAARRRPSDIGHRGEAVGRCKNKRAVKIRYGEGRRRKCARGVPLQVGIAVTHREDGPSPYRIVAKNKMVIISCGNAVLGRRSCGSQPRYGIPTSG